MSHDRDRDGDGPRGDGRERGGDRGGGGDRRGPGFSGHWGHARQAELRPQAPDSAFLNLEMSRVMYSEAEQLAREAGRELMREAIKERLRERLGDRLLALARLAADELADDLLANLDIEARIEERRRARQGLPGRIAEAARDVRQSLPHAAAPAESAAESDRKK